jgi:threonine aldolase
MYAPDMGPFFVRTTAVSVENTHNFAGGTVLPLEDLQALRSWADSVGCGLHLDGARLWNAHVASGVPLASYGACVDVLSVCLSKGLGAPVGSLVVGSADAIAQARVRRKRMGGGMRQIGVLAAAGAHALDHHVERLADDHAHARRLAEGIGIDPATVETNFVPIPDEPDLRERLLEQGVGVGGLRPGWLRAVTHLDIGDDEIEQAIERIQEVLSVHA